jgi:hypothetical protein
LLLFLINEEFFSTTFMGSTAGGHDNTNVNDMHITQTRNSKQSSVGRTSNLDELVVDLSLRRQIDNEIIMR